MYFAILNTVVRQVNGAIVPPPPAQVQWELITTNWEAEARNWEAIV